MKQAIIGHLALAASLAVSTLAAQAQNLSEAERQMMFVNLAEADADADSAISRGEFEVLINLNAADNIGRAARIVRTGRYDMAFDRIDTDGDGFLTEAEMQALAEQVQG